MKRKILSFTVAKPKTRDRFGLFTEDSPFKAKIVDSKERYKRQPKHRNKPEGDLS